MKFNTRYWFMKKIYPDYLFLFKTNKNKLGYKCFGKDRYILDYIRDYKVSIEYITNRLELLNINYILIDNITITKIYSTDNNKYNYNLNRFFIINLLNRMRSCIYKL